MLMKCAWLFARAGDAARRLVKRRGQLLARELSKPGPALLHTLFGVPGSVALLLPDLGLATNLVIIVAAWLACAYGLMRLAKSRCPAQSAAERRHHHPTSTPQP